MTSDEYHVNEQRTWPNEYSATFAASGTTALRISDTTRNIDPISENVSPAYSLFTTRPFYSGSSKDSLGKARLLADGHTALLL